MKKTDAPWVYFVWRVYEKKRVVGGVNCMKKNVWKILNKMKMETNGMNQPITQTNSHENEHKKKYIGWIISINFENEILNF